MTKITIGTIKDNDEEEDKPPGTIGGLEDHIGWGNDGGVSCGDDDEDPGNSETMEVGGVPPKRHTLQGILVTRPRRYIEINHRYRL